MFVTTSAAELVFPAGLAPQDCRYFDVVSLPAFFPWYILTHHFSDDENEGLQTSLIGSDQALVEACKHFGCRLVSVSRLQYQGGLSKTWGLQRIRCLWIAAEIEGAEISKLVFSFEDSSDLVDGDGASVHLSEETRRLLFQQRSVRN